jgi:hypothetical protein
LGYIQIFLEVAVFSVWKDFLRGKFSMGSKVFGAELSRGNFTRGNSPEFLQEILFICLNFSLATPFYMWRCCGRIDREKFSTLIELFGFFPVEGDFLHGRNPPWGSSPWEKFLMG